MHPALAGLILFAAALLEAGGDALVRLGLRAPFGLTRAAFLLAGAAILFAYGLTVNAPPWNFGRLIGVYVAFFFLLAQLLDLLLFGALPDARRLLGGSLIVAGALVIAL